MARSSSKKKQVNENERWQNGREWKQLTEAATKGVP